MFTFNTKSSSWKAISTFGVPPEKAVPSARRGHTTDLYETGLKNRGPIFLVFGGSGPEPVKSRDVLLNDLWAFELDINKWRRLKHRGELPSARCNHDSILIGDKLFIYGGVTETHASDELFCLNIPKLRWSLFFRRFWRFVFFVGRRQHNTDLFSTEKCRENKLH